MSTKTLKFTLEEYKDAASRFEALDFGTLSERDVQVLSEILRRDIKKREKQLATKQKNLQSFPDQKVSDDPESSHDNKKSADEKVS